MLTTQHGNSFMPLNPKLCNPEDLLSVRCPQSEEMIQVPLKDLMVEAFKNAGPN